MLTPLNEAAASSKLHAVADGLWVVDSELPLGLGSSFPLRATIARLPTGGLWVHSPVRFNQATADAIDAIGAVEHLVSPSLLHHLWLGDAADRWPAATCWSDAGLAAKRADLRPCASLDRASFPWDSTLQTLALQGAPTTSERVFFHIATRTLIVTDLVFNIAHPKGIVQAGFTCLFGTYGRVASSRAWDLLFVRDRSAFAASCAQVCAWPIEALIPAHGDLVPSNAGPRVAQALERWTRRAKVAT